MIKILHVLSTVSKTAGVANVLMNYYRVLDKTKIQFEFLVFAENDNTFNNEIESLGGKVYLISKPSIRTLNNYIKQLKKFFIMHKTKYKVVQLHDLYLNSIIFPIAKNYGGVNHCIAHCHGTMYSDKRLNAIRNYLLFLPLKRNATSLFACSKKAAVFAYGEKAYRDGKTYILNNAIDISKYKYDEKVRLKKRNKLGLEDRFVVGHVGQFTPVKNHKFIIDMFEELLCNVKNAHLLLIGQGDNYNEISELIKIKGIENNVSMLGSRNDVSELLQCMDVFILPSLREGLPVSVVEAQSAGLKVILSDTITREVGICNTEYLSINKNIKKWVSALEGIHQGYLRCDTTEYITNGGFNINIESQKLLELYLTL